MRLFARTLRLWDLARTSPLVLTVTGGMGLFHLTGQLRWRQRPHINDARSFRYFSGQVGSVLPPVTDQRLRPAFGVSSLACRASTRPGVASWCGPQRGPCSLRPGPPSCSICPVQGPELGLCCGRGSSIPEVGKCWSTAHAARGIFQRALFPVHVSTRKRPCAPENSPHGPRAAWACARLCWGFQDRDHHQLRMEIPTIPLHRVAP